jgi:glucose-6-phosphate 1-dehydrogenase
MVANHLLQLLALTAMEAPVAFDADAVRDKKIEVWRSIAPMTPAQVGERTVRAQYATAQSDDAEVPGWHDEPDVPASSRTETYAVLLLDALRGDPTLFTRRDGVEAQWRLITPIEQAWAADTATPLATYRAGSEGPPEADRLLARQGHGWRDIAENRGACAR